MFVQTPLSCSCQWLFRHIRRPDRNFGKARSRGFWPLKSSKGKGKGKVKKGKGGHRYQSLAERMASSACRICGMRGHWKDGCPQKERGQNTADANASLRRPMPRRSLWALCRMVLWAAGRWGIFKIQVNINPIGVHPSPRVLMENSLVIYPMS